MVKNNAWNFDTTYTTGDILYASTTSNLSKLAIGSAGEYLTIAAGLPDWAIVSGGTQSSQTYSLFSECDPGYSGDQNGISGIVTTLAPDAGHPGVIQISTLTSSSAIETCLFYYGTVLNNGTYNLDIVAKIPTLSTSAQRFNAYVGFFDAIPVVNGCYFYYRDNVNSGRWQIKCTFSSTTTTTNTTTTADTNWHKFSVRVNSTATSVAFYIDDVEVSGSPITTNIPTAIVAAGIGIDKDVGTTARTLNVDYVQMDVSLTSARS